MIKLNIIIYKINNLKSFFIFYFDCLYLVLSLIENSQDFPNLFILKKLT